MAPLPDYHLSSVSNSKISNSISHCVQMELIKEIQAFQSIGILIGESKDVSDHEILLLYIRFWSKKDQKAKDVFVTSFNLSRKLSGNL